MEGGTVLDLGGTFGIPVDCGTATFMVHAGMNWQSALMW